MWNKKLILDALFYKLSLHLFPMPRRLPLQPHPSGKHLYYRGPAVRQMHGDKQR